LTCSQNAHTSRRLRYCPN